MAFTSVHHFRKHVSTVTMTQVPAHRGQPTGCNSWTSGTDRWTESSKIRRMEVKSVIFCKMNLRGREWVELAALCWETSLIKYKTGLAHTNGSEIFGRTSYGNVLMPSNHTLHLTYAKWIGVLKPWLTWTITVLRTIASFSSKDAAQCLDLAL